MVKGHNKNLAFVGGEVARWLLRHLSAGVFAPEHVPENPWRAKEPESPALKAHREAWEKAKWRGLVHACQQ